MCFISLNFSFYHASLSHRSLEWRQRYIKLIAEERADFFSARRMIWGYNSPFSRSKTVALKRRLRINQYYQHTAGKLNLQLIQAYSFSRNTFHSAGTKTKQALSRLLRLSTNKRYKAKLKPP